MRTFACDSKDAAFFYQGMPSCDVKKTAPTKLISTCSQNCHMEYVSLEIREEILHKLINQGALVIEDLRGLKRDARDNMKRLILNDLLS